MYIKYFDDLTCVCGVYADSWHTHHLRVRHARGQPQGLWQHRCRHCLHPLHRCCRRHTHQHFGYLLPLHPGNKPPRDLRIALLKLCIPLGGLSTFLNNTPIYVMAVPVIMRWCRKVGIAPSKVLMPVSISIILGGTISLIGTSTNLVVSGLAEADKTLLDLKGNRMKFDFFGISKVCGKSTQSCVDHQP